MSANEVGPGARLASPRGAVSLDYSLSSGPTGGVINCHLPLISERKRGGADSRGEQNVRGPV